LRWSWRIEGDRNFDSTLRPARAGLFSMVVEKRAGTWQIIAAQNTNAGSGNAPENEELVFPIRMPASPGTRLNACPLQGKFAARRPQPGNAPAMFGEPAALTSRRVQAVALTAALTLAFAMTQMPTLVIYNHTPSIPMGWYVRVDAAIATGAIVSVKAGDVAAAYAAHRGADPDTRFLKRVAASAGDRVCAAGATITINGREAATRTIADSRGRPLPTWEGCAILGADDVLLLGDSPDSFDGRYWGLTSARGIEATWRPVVN
jgi:conjugative transfer signal peptidase TraF